MLEVMEVRVEWVLEIACMRECAETESCTYRIFATQPGTISYLTTASTVEVTVASLMIKIEALHIWTWGCSRTIPEVSYLCTIHKLNTIIGIRYSAGHNLLWSKMGAKERAVDDPLHQNEFLMESVSC